MSKFFYKNKKNLIIISFFIFFSFLLVKPVFANSTAVGQSVVMLVSWIVASLAYVFGYILTLIISVLANVAAYNNIINVGAVSTGWTIVRDLCNMFFVLIFLVIAFATILKIESYNAKKLLPKLLIMAVLINFSKTICGLIIDFSQVIMLTFVNGFSSKNATGNFVKIFQIDNYLSFSEASNALENNDNLVWETLLGFIAGLIALMITLVVCIVLTAVLVMRVVMLWVYTILSPIAYLCSAFPEGKKYSSQWWSEFSKNVVTGPVLAFFIWLALLTAQESSSDLQMDVATATKDLSVVSSGSTLFQTDNFQTYLITIALLMGGIMVTQQLGGMAGKIAGKGMAAIQSGQKWATGKIARTASDWSRVSTAQQYLKMRREKNDAIRADKIEGRASKLAGMIGGVKKGTLGNLGKGANWLNERSFGRWGKEAKSIDKDIDKDREDLAGIKESIKDKKGFEYDGNKYKYSENAKKWEMYNSDGNRVRSIIQEDGVTTDDYITDDAMFDNFEKGINNNINKKKIKSNKLKNTQNTMNKLYKTGFGVAGAGLGFATGGAGFAAISGMAAGGAAGGFGLSGVKNSIRDAGSTDLKIASGYRSKETSAQRDKMKNDSNEAVLATMNDPSKSPFARAAAAMEAMSRKILDLETAKEKREEINKNMKGDKGIMSQVEATLEKNYVGATSSFRDIEQADKDMKNYAAGTDKYKEAERKKAVAERNIRSRYEGGAYSLKDLDSSSIDSSRNQMAKGLKTGKFVSQFKDLDSDKQAAIIRSLKKGDSYESKEKLAHVTNIDIAFAGRPNSDIQKFTKSLSMDKINEILTKGTDAQIKALKKAVSGKSDLSDSVVKAMENGQNRIAQSIKKELGLS